MDKKDLLARATEKLDRHPSPRPAPDPQEPAPESPKAPRPTPPPRKKAGRAQTSASRPNGTANDAADKSEDTTAGEGTEVVEPVVKKGITLRPSNIRKLDELELELRNLGLKTSQSALIQIAVDGLESGPELEEACRKAITQDLRFRAAEKESRRSTA